MSSNSFKRPDEPTKTEYKNKDGSRTVVSHPKGKKFFPGGATGWIDEQGFPALQKRGGGFTGD
ncbi:MAG: hypothetical protein IJQ81_12140 [Oscillibacter sp.]|nr:hypothetical protein [Oscillibacter sp.]